MNNENDMNARIRNVRLSRGITQEQMAKILGINRVTYINIEKGIRRISFDELKAICNSLGMSLSDITTTAFQLSESLNSKEKLKQVYYYILSFFEKGVPKTKLAKLLYLSDFLYYFDNGHSISGSKYIRLKYGPVAEKFFLLTDELFYDGKINIDILDDAQMISMSSTNAEYQNISLSEEEKETIRTVCEYWKDKRTSEIVNFTHSQDPWKKNKDGEYIPYSSIMNTPRERVYAPLI